MTPSAQIIEVLDYLGQKIGITIDWTAENIMPYLQELFHRFITYEIAKTAVDMVLATALFVAGLLCIKPFMRNINKDINDYQAVCISVICGVIILFGFLMFFCVVPNSIYHLIECLTIPEKTLYDYIATLMK